MLVGAIAKPSTSRANAKKAFYFNITHPQCGMRELYAKSSIRRNQWCEKINEAITEIENSGALAGTLYKQGGYSKNVWQERWSVSLGNCLFWYDNPSDNSPKGFIDLRSAKVRDFSSGKDRPFCFEIVANSAGKKGMKKYNWSVETESERKKWIIALNKAANATVSQRQIGGGDIEVASNPIHGSAGSPPVAEDMDLTFRSSQRAGPLPAEKMGIYFDITGT